MSIHVDFAPVRECGNADAYGEICVKCNQCGRFATFTRGASDWNNRMIGLIPCWVHDAWQRNALKLAKARKDRFARVTVRDLRAVAPKEVLEQTP